MSVKTRRLRERNRSSKARRHQKEIRRCDEHVPPLIPDEETVSDTELREELDEYFSESARIGRKFEAKGFAHRLIPKTRTRLVDNSSGHHIKTVDEHAVAALLGPAANIETGSNGSYLAYSEKGKERFARSTTTRRAANKFEHWVEGVLKVVFEHSKTGKRIELGVTAEHPFYVINKGWVPIGDMKIGDACVTDKGESAILISRRKVPGRVKVYNLEVEDCHTYFVGSLDCALLVHNKVRPDGTPDPEKVILGNSFSEKRENIKNMLPAGLASSVIAFWGGTDNANADDMIRKLVERAGLAGLYINLEYANKGAGMGGSGTGYHQIWGSKPGSPEFVGASGMGPCIGVVIYSPSTGLRAAFHFDQGNAATNTLNRYNWPADCRAIIAGAHGGNFTTRDQLAEILGYLRHAGIKVEGFGFTKDIAGIYVDQSGNWIVVPSKIYLDFVNPPQTVRPQ